MLIRKVDRVRQVPFVNQNLEHQPAARHGPDTGVEVLAQDVVLVLLALDPMAQPLQLLASVERLHAPGKILARNRRPSHHPPNRVGRIGQVQQPVRFLQRLPRLHRNRSVDARRRHRRLQVRQQKVPAQQLHLIVDPPILRRRIPP
jgi:hypothetical protein